MLETPLNQSGIVHKMHSSVHNWNGLLPCLLQLSSVLVSIPYAAPAPDIALALANVLALGMIDLRYTFVSVTNLEDELASLWLLLFLVDFVCLTT